MKVTRLSAIGPRRNDLMGTGSGRAPRKRLDGVLDEYVSADGTKTVDAGGPSVPTGSTTRAHLS